MIGAKPGAKGRQLTTSPESDGEPYGKVRRHGVQMGKPSPTSTAAIRRIEYAVHSLAIISAAGGEAKVLTQNLDRNVLQPHWSADGKSVFCVVEDDRAETLVRVPAAGGTPETVVGGRRKVTAYDVSKTAGHRPRDTPERPYEIFAAEEDNLRRLTKQNDAFLAQIKLAPVSESKFKSKDGTEVHGFVVRPVGPAGETPALLRPHGGPQSQYANEFDFEKQLFAANGYTVVMPNPRGSSSRGEKYCMGIYAAWGSVDVEDDLAAVDDAVARGLADPDRLVVGGWSYGGISTNYLIATTTRFKAATSGVSISNVLAGYGTDQYIRDYENELGVPWKNPETWMRLSYPFLHADRIKTPTLFLCGRKTSTFASQHRTNVSSTAQSRCSDRACHLSRPSHGLKKPSYIIDRYKRHLDWYARWIRE